MANFPTPALSGRLLKLTDPSGPIAAPLDDDPPESRFEPIAFAPFPLSQSAWLTGLAEYFYSRHKRGLAALLILDTASGNWTRPALPSQRCSAEGASFQLCAEDFEDFAPRCRVGGSFPLTHAATAEEAQTQVPAFDGLHQVYAISGTARMKHFFLRMEGAVHLVLPECFLIDDWRQYIHHNHDRLSFP